MREGPRRILVLATARERSDKVSSIISTTDFKWAFLLVRNAFRDEGRRLDAATAWTLDDHFWSVERVYG